MRIVPVKSVPNGSLLGKTIFDNNGRLLFKEGMLLNSDILNRIKDSNISSLYIIEPYCKKEIQYMIKSTLERKFKSFNFFDIVSQNLLNYVVNDELLINNLLDIKNMDNYTYKHCINVAVISLIIGIKLGLDEINLKDLFIGALLHDIGKLFIPKHIINKSSSLTSEEFQFIKKHPIIGYNYLKKNLKIDSQYTLIILQHHERIDGKGYPYNLNSAEIYYLSKIVSIADVYDALNSTRPYKVALCTNDVLTYISNNSGIMFDDKLIPLFVELAYHI
ncbi:HD-GYP domain-containing protein [Clostridium sp. HBUAS56017]|uniref:HD-GYP domain-containing protein n=1 Tax=Clostridium sp. HBUAS56017 TaxID=2571128 RepID=UPI001177DAC7|nr:HD-GYP domain-containing protein [Clostridium sp. HBUAS56017]